MIFDKQHYKELKKYAKVEGIKTISVPYSAGMFGNGVTIAYIPSTNSGDNRMIIVSVSYCAPEDEFKKKIGKYQAYLKYLKGEFVQLPLGRVYPHVDKNDFEAILIEMFSPAD